MLWLCTIHTTIICIIPKFESRFLGCIGPKIAFLIWKNHICFYINPRCINPKTFWVIFMTNKMAFSKYYIEFIKDFFPQKCKIQSKLDHFVNLLADMIMHNGDKAIFVHFPHNLPHVHLYPLHAFCIECLKYKFNCQKNKNLI